LMDGDGAQDGLNHGDQTCHMEVVLEQIT
jgi:hypothetical protein